MFIQKGKTKDGLGLLLFLFFFSACSISKKGYHPEQKIPPEALKADFTIFRNVLEESHPSLYWFTPKDSMDQCFDRVFGELKDSMTERDFRTKMSFVVSRIRCGHTSLHYSARYADYLDTAKLNVFPLRFKILGDTAIVTGTLLQKDSLFPRGTIVTSINGYEMKQLRDTFFQYLPGDGFSVAGRYQSLSNLGNFGVLYKNLFGLPDSLKIGYLDSSGHENFAVVPVFDPKKDSVFRRERPGDRALRGRERRRFERDNIRNIQIDREMSAGFMTLNTFAAGNGLRRFFRKSFKAMRKQEISHLLLDLRGNGGGDAGNSTLLTQYIISDKFKVADSLYAIKRSSRYSRYIGLQPVYWLMMTMVTHKRNDKFHFGFFERHTFRPKRKNHFKGNLYVLTGGNSFSATTIFAQKIKGQPNVTLVGEETGGGAYGNTAWMIPMVRLPNTGIRFRLPKFRLVMNKDLVAEGRGVIPDITVYPSAAEIRNGVDVKVEAVRRMILEKNKKSMAER